MAKRSVEHAVLPPPMIWIRASVRIWLALMLVKATRPAAGMFKVVVIVCTTVHDARHAVAAFMAPVLSVLSKILTVTPATAPPYAVRAALIETMSRLKLVLTTFVPIFPSNAFAGVVVSNALKRPGTAVKPESVSPMAKSP